MLRFAGVVFVWSLGSVASAQLAPGQLRVEGCPEGFETELARLLEIELDVPVQIVVRCGQVEHVVELSHESGRTHSSHVAAGGGADELRSLSLQLAEAATALAVPPDHREPDPDAPNDPVEPRAPRALPMTLELGALGMLQEAERWRGGAHLFLRIGSPLGLVIGLRFAGGPEPAVVAVERAWIETGAVGLEASFERGVWLGRIAALGWVGVSHVLAMRGVTPAEPQLWAGATLRLGGGVRVGASIDVLLDIEGGGSRRIDVVVQNDERVLGTTEGPRWLLAASLGARVRLR